MEYTDSFLQKLRLVIAGLAILAGTLIVWALFNIPRGNAEADNSNAIYEDRILLVSDSDNAVTAGMTSFLNEVAQTSRSVQNGAHNTADAMGDSLYTARSFVAKGGKAIGKGVINVASAIGNGIGTGIGFIASTTTDGVVFVLRTPGNVVGFITNSSAMSGMIRPTEHADTPIIDPNSPALLEARAAMATVVQEAPAINTEAVWPMHGAVTTEFGVKHWPYQPIHTGIDISDGKRAGVTPIRPFKPGKVTETIYSRNGLGNHVVVDHGSGVTSVYAHLSSISVKLGQDVDSSSILGLEGSTGVSTGTHLHFEIRVNGEAADPSQFISGRP